MGQRPSAARIRNHVYLAAYQRMRASYNLMKLYCCKHGKLNYWAKVSGCQMDITRLDNLSLGDDDFDELMTALYRDEKLETLPAIYCEHRLIKFARKKEEPLSSSWASLNELLVRHELPVIDNWAWTSPIGNVEGSPSLELNTKLASIGHLVSRGEINEAKALATSPLLAHALLRNLIVTRKIDVLHVALNEFADPTLLLNVLTMARSVLGKEATSIAQTIALSQSAKESQELTYEAIKTIMDNPMSDSGDVIFRATFALKNSSGYGVPESNPRYLWRIASRNVPMPTCADEYIIEKVNSGENMCPEDLLAALEFAARNEDAIENRIYEFLVMQVLERHPHIFSEAKSEDRDLLLGKQALYTMGRILWDPDVPSKHLLSVLKLLTNIGLIPPPVDTLPALLDHLFKAIPEARNNPGKVWEDRNYGGYDLSPQESLAGSLGETIKTLLVNEYGKEYWDSVRTRLKEFDEQALRKLELPEFTGGALAYEAMDLIDIVEKSPDKPSPRNSNWFFNAMPLSERISHLLDNEPTAARQNFRERLDLRGADFKGRDLSNRELTWMNFAGASFREANLQNTEFLHCDLKKTDLRGANMAHTICTKSDFLDAKLWDTDFSGADLREAHYIKGKLKWSITDNSTLID